jgi:hypothetical protein
MGRFYLWTTLLLAAAVWAPFPDRQLAASEPRSKATSVLRQDETRHASPSDAYGVQPSARTPSNGGTRGAPLAHPLETAESSPPDEYILDDNDVWYPQFAEGSMSELDTMGFPSGFWASFDYLLWWRQGQPLPPLVTTDPNGGVLPDATVLFGGDREGTGVRPGGRFRGGGWLDMEGVMAAEVGFFALGDGRFEFAADSDTYPTLARPFFNLLPANGAGVYVGPDSLQIAFPNSSTGDVRVAGESEIMGGDVTFRGLLSQSTRARVDFLAGYQWARIDESLTVLSSTHLGSNRLDVFDSFETQNRFHGGSVGLELVRTYGRWNLELMGRLGFGNMRQNVMIDGFSRAEVGGSASTTAGGLLAQPTNIGRFQRNAFAVNPEVGFTLNCQVTDRFNLAAGYSFLSWNKVAQPGDQIDPLLAVNPDQPPADGAPARPSFEFRDSRFFLHGVHAGLEFVF